MSEWIDVGSEDEWEDVGSKPKEPNSVIQAGKNAVGGVDAAVNMLAGVPSYIAGGLTGLGTLLTTGDAAAADAVRQGVTESNFGFGAPKPFTKAGGEATEALGHGMEALKEHVGDAGGDSPAARSILEGTTEALMNFMPIPGGKLVGKAGKAIEKKLAKPELPKSKAAEVFDKKTAAAEQGWVDVGEKAFNDMGAELVKGQSDPLPTRTDPMDFMKQQLELQRQSEVQKGLEARQAELEMEVKRQQGLDFNAAERARQEAAPVLPEHQANMAGDAAIQRSAERLIDPRDGQNAKLSAELGNQPIHVDPQGQAFRGDPRERGAMEALERQGAAMDTELTHLRGKGTPDGDPLRPLQDPMREAIVDPIRQLNLRSKKQGGAINPEVFKQGFEKLKEIGDGIVLRARMTSSGFLIQAMKGSEEVGRAQLDPVQIGTNKWMEDFKTVRDNPEWHNLESSSTEVHGDHQGKGIAKEMYKFASELGNDVQASGVQSHAGRGMWEAFERSGLSERGVIPAQKTSGTLAGAKIGKGPKYQRGAVGDVGNNPIQMKKNEQQRSMAQHFSNLGLEEWDVIKTKDEALTLAKEAKDITRDIGQKNLVSGINMESALTNNPILKFARTVLRDARAWMDSQSRKYITANDTGLSSLWPKLSKEDRINLMDALMEADKRQEELTLADMDEMGFTKEMKQFAETFRKADEALLAKQNENAVALGLEPTERRVGHFPGIFTGAYKTLVTIDKGGSKGKPHKSAVAVLATDTKAQQKLAMENILMLSLLRRNVLVWLVSLTATTLISSLVGTMF
jgi:hypothetical protein